MTAAEQAGDTVSAVVRAALSAYLRDPAGYWTAVTPAKVNGPSLPSFSHEETRVKPWRWDRPLGYKAAQQPQQPCTPIHSAPISRQKSR